MVDTVLFETEVLRYSTIKNAHTQLLTFIPSFIYQLKFIKCCCCGFLCFPFVCLHIFLCMYTNQNRRTERVKIVCNIGPKRGDRQTERERKGAIP